MSKGGGKGHTPREAKDDLKSTQQLSVIDALSEGPIVGPVNGLQSVLINNTPVVDADGNSNIHGVTVVYQVGETPQSPLEGFEASGAETVLGVEVKHDNPVTRTVVSENIDRLRFTFGVQMLQETTDKGDRNPSSVNLLIQFQRSGIWNTEFDITINGKITTQYLASVVADNLPPRPFSVRMVRVTPDSTTDRLQNKTLWSSYTEIIDIRQGYPGTAVAGLLVDAEQFGSQQVTRNYHLRGRIFQVPSNYDPDTRTYTGLWDGTLKPAYTNNPAWCTMDILTHPRYGLGRRIGVADVDKWALYAIAQYCDQQVPDGFGGTEPRMTLNAYMTSQRKAYDVLADFCSVMRCMPVWNGSRMTFVQDRPSDSAWTYTNSNVVGGRFKYSFSALKDRHNAIEVRYTDPLNGWQTSMELVEDHASQIRYGRNLLKMDAFGCTSRGQAHRTGLWVMMTELLETQTVDFSVGAEGLRHTPGDIIEVCDNDYAGASIGGRITDLDISTRTLTLDREITLPESGAATLNIVGPDGTPFSTEIQSQPAPDRVVLKVMPETVQPYSIWGLKLPSLKRRLFRCVRIKENDDGTYAITAVQHVPEKESIVDNGAHFDPLPGTTNGIIPPAVQHLVVDTDNDSILYQAKAKWDTPRVVKGVRFVVRLTTGSGKEGDPVRLVTTATTSETEYAFHELPLGDYTLTVRAINGFGQQGEPASVAFSIQAPEAPSTIEMTPGYFQITVTPYQAIYDASVQYEFWYSATQLATAADIQSKAQYLGTGSFWIKDNIRPGHDAWFYVRSVNRVGKSAFAEASGQCSDDAEGYLAFFDGKIQQTQLAKELLDKMDNTALKQDIADISKIVSETKNEIEQTVNKTLGDQSATISQIQKVQTDTDNNLNALYMLKVQKTKDGVPYVAGIGAGIEDVAGQTLSQILLAANRTAIIDPSDGNTVPMLVAQGGQIFLNEALVKYLIAPTITSGGDPPAFSLTPDGKLTAKNADISGHINAVSGSFTGEINATSGKFSGVIEAKEFVGDICGSKVMQGVSIRATNDERSTSTRYTDSATYQIGKTITVMANCERNGGSGAITVTININGQVKTAEVMPYTAGIPAMYQTVVFSVHTTSPVVDISVSLRVSGRYTTEASVWPLVMVSRSGNNFTN
ncbi:host specificity protein J [Salmonella enterica subsp. enterica serovar Muenchen]|uniref:host specificity protein J n=11 Tax=Salmonella enterica TaxID=28901 RepID=UPI0009AE8595|nr:host specificity protein J [Salmonella enterica]EBP3872529.1 host specificity protein J [Salmonella enterica subsp. enterica]EDJ3622009.1 host specificity protein J [Salmonella enterica subsp. enterica serovar Muenchen]EJV7054946.1 host specificity protein J [Salmonella enterica subsp. enterica serovar Rubislaw]EAA7222698.1 host specificity protein J [Salmonella enterica]EAW9369993.1 host specificity protein J [Salmonella enterica]